MSGVDAGIGRLLRLSANEINKKTNKANPRLKSPVLPTTTHST